MTRPTVTPTTAQLAAHARELAVAFNVRLIEASELQPHEALGLLHLRVALVAPIVDETTYAVALHEIGHMASPTGVVRHVATGDRGNLMRAEEDAAWTWAKHYALVWSPLMEALATWCEGTYAPAQEKPTAPAAAPQAPVAPPSIDWKKWK